MNEPTTESSFIYQFIEENAEAIFVLDDSYKIIFWNRNCETLLGISSRAALKKRIEQVIPEFSGKYFQTYASDAMALKAAVGEKSFSLSRRGKPLSLRPIFSPIRLPDVVCCMVTLRVNDVQDKTKSFKPFIEESPLATVIFSIDGSPKYFNKAFHNLWEATPEAINEVSSRYNIFEDEQLNELGIMPFIHRGFSGETVEIPPISYRPSETFSIQDLALQAPKYVKGYIFSTKDEAGAVEDVVILLSDVTFQKEAEEILTDTHLNFQMLTIGLPGVIYELEEQTNGNSCFRYISEGCFKTFGFTPEEIMRDGNLLNAAIHPDDLEAFVLSEINSRKNMSEWHWEGRIIVDGKDKWIVGKSSPSLKKDGSITRYGLLLDITDKKKVEEQYRLSEERLQLALQGAELGLWDWTLNDRKTIHNKGWAAKFGYDQRELEAKFEHWDELIHPEDLANVNKKLQQHLEGKTAYYEAEYRFRTKDNSYRWILDKGRAMEWDENGEVIKVSGTYFDINDKKNAELLIERNEQLFTQLFENSPMGIVMLNEQHKVIQMNQGFKDIFGYVEQDIIGNQLNNILVPEDYRQEAIDINRLGINGKVSIIESKRKHKNGKLIPVIIYGVPVNFDSKTIGIYGIYVDITDRKAAENELQIRNNELDNFVYKVSHDLRAPLSSILGLINLAHHKANTDDLLDYMGLIESRVQQLDSFINDVLSHSKNLKLAVEIDPIDLRAVVDNCFLELNYLPLADKVKKEINITDHLLYSDKWRVNEIFRNLISNAIKYLNPHIENPFVSIKITVTEEAAFIEIADNGIGIENSILPKVFEMFYRATEKAEGSGIGLYIVKNALQKLNGNIEVRSEPSVGTTFNITIPNLLEEYLNSNKE